LIDLTFRSYSHINLLLFIKFTDSVHKEVTSCLLIYDISYKYFDMLYGPIKLLGYMALYILLFLNITRAARNNYNYFITQQASSLRDKSVIS
jgi:hypothetical protein